MSGNNIKKRATMRNKVSFIFATVVLCLFSCSRPDHKDGGLNDFYEGFVNPPAEARPFVRWWWNGNHLTKDEIIRQLDVLHTAGIGGIEINPIEMPEEAKDVGTHPLVWLSPEWNQMLIFAAREAKKRDMISDMIVGSGWPFGGEFLKEDETIQRVLNNTIPLKAGMVINETLETLVKKVLDIQTRKYPEKALSNEVFYLTLIPNGLNSTGEVINIIEHFVQNKISYKVPDGNYVLSYGILQKGHRNVMHGALGAAGPVMNHFDRNITMDYLNRLKKITEDTGVPLSEIIRALFCDSIELAGANWMDDFEDIFYQTYGYNLTPYFPFIFYEPHIGYTPSDYNEELLEEIKRVRYDYNKLIVRIFLDNFTKAFQEYCTANNLKARYQAYGTPFLMGMMEGNMLTDIPESNNWIYSANMDADEWRWNQEHGYMIWNLYAASGGHLTGRKIISCEAMTNTRGVFKTSLEEIKQHDDMNFITGMNHAVLHGYNYSPREAGFPGWVRYGSYFSEQNPWWPYFHKWVDYNARLSYVFQNSQPVKKIAIVGPTGDIWGNSGLARMPFHMKPWYTYKLWEPLSQAGSSCDYISEQIIAEGDITGGTLKYGPMTYQAIMLTNIKSLEPQTVQTLLEYAKQGGKLVLVDEVPNRSLSFQDAATNDTFVKKSFSEMLEKYPKQVFTLVSPASEDKLLSWTMALLDQIDIEPDVKIANPDKAVYQIHKMAGNNEIYFFVNSHRKETANLQVSFPVKGKSLWRWNPETGTKSTVSFEKLGGELIIELNPMESMLLVFEPNNKHAPEVNGHTTPGELVSLIEGPWKVDFTHINGDRFSRNFDQLEQFGTSEDKQLNTFAGTVTYSTTFMAEGDEGWLELEKVNKGVTEVYVNGNPIGINWYGKPIFPLKNVLKEGENKLEIKYTTVLSNYSRSLKDEPTAVRWTEGFVNIPMGLEGGIALFGKPVVSQAAN
jgi:hypothetical protein